LDFENLVFFVFANSSSPSGFDFVALPLTLDSALFKLSFVSFFAFAVSFSPLSRLIFSVFLAFD